MWWAKKSIAIFGNKQWVFSIEMKAKLVQHVESDWMREWESVRVWECESVRVWECESVRVRECESERVTFEHRHENKSCSACREWVNKRVKEWESESVKVREWLLSIDMKTKFVQHVESEWMREWESERERVREREWEREWEFWFPAFVWHSDIFIWEPKEL